MADGVELWYPLKHLAPKDYNGKNLKKFFCSEIMRPSAYIFSMLQGLAVPYINPTNQAPPTPVV